MARSWARCRAAATVLAAAASLSCNSGNGTLHLLLHVFPLPGQLGLLPGVDLQLGRFLRQEVLDLLGQRAAAEIRGPLAKFFLVALQLGDLAVEPPVAVPAAQIADQCRPTRQSPAVGACRRRPIGRGQPGRAADGPSAAAGRLLLQADLRRLDRGRQLPRDDGKLLPVQPLQFAEHALHPPSGLRAAEAVILQLLPQGEDLHRQAVGAAGQRADHLPLVELDAAEVVQVELVQQADFPGADLQFADLFAALLSIPLPASIRPEGRAWRETIRSVNSSGVTTLSRRGSLVPVCGR